MKKTWFTQTNLTPKEADELIARYRARGETVQRTIAADPRLFDVHVLLPESANAPKQSSIYQQRAWG